MSPDKKKKEKKKTSRNSRAEARYLTKPKFKTKLIDAAIDRLCCLKTADCFHQTLLATQPVDIYAVGRL